jgi:predicted aconitase with swiveling domain
MYFRGIERGLLMSTSEGRHRATFTCHKICGGKAEGEILISSDGICFYLAEPKTGEMIEKNHPLKGQKVARKILVFPGGKGSSIVQGEGLYMLKKYGNAPLAMIIRNPDTVLVSGAIIMKIPLVDRVDPGFYQQVGDGDHVEVNADEGLITLVKRTDPGA